MADRWGNSGNSVSVFFLGSKITADGDCSHEIKRCLLLGRKVMTNLDSILKSRDIVLPAKIHLVKAMVFPLVMYGCELDSEESWAPKKLMLLNCGVGEDSFFSFSFIFISWRLITLQYCSGFYHTLTGISHGFTCVPHPDPPSHLPPHPIPLGLPSAPGPSTCLMHPTWAGDLFHPR